MTDSGMRNGAIAMAVDTISSLANLVFDVRVNARPLPERHREVVLSAIFSPPKSYSSRSLCLDFGKTLAVDTTTPHHPNGWFGLKYSW